MELKVLPVQLAGIFFNGLVQSHHQLSADRPAVAFDSLADDSAQGIKMDAVDFKIGIVFAAGIGRGFVKDFCEQGYEWIAEGAALTTQFMGDAIDFGEVVRPDVLILKGLGHLLRQLIEGHCQTKVGELTTI